MDTILDQLFECDIAFAQDREFERLYSSAVEAVCQAGKAIKDSLPSEQFPMVRNYMEKALLYQKLDCQLEFERGFLLAGKILLEVIYSQSEGTGYRDRSKNEGL